MKKILRGYQQTAVNECWQSLKDSDDPIVLMASVGAGKSLMLADILLTMQKNDKRALCLVNNAELVKSNCETFEKQGGNASIYCAALGEKNTRNPVIFASPKTVLNAINKNRPIKNIRFNIIVVDEAHMINYNNPRCTFMRIFRHYKHEYPAMRLLGATGTPFRFKGYQIVGKQCLFKKQVGNITTERLISDGYLIEPYFSIDKNLLIDFSGVSKKKNGLFDQKQIESVVSSNTRLTKQICKQIVHVIEEQKRFGVFLFATTRKHAQEILSYLPPDESALILGDTPQDKRNDILSKARKGKIKYLVNISIIAVGVDVPAYDTIAYLRPTESLVLMTQTMGRALRLSHDTNKSEALVMDFAGNIDRHKDWDNPIIMKAAAQTVDKEKPLVIQCPQCMAMNTETARRCIGVNNGIRCDYFFNFKVCDNKECEALNDIAARLCRLCEHELIDPNDKLSMQSIAGSQQTVKVLKAKYGISGTNHRFTVNAAYQFETDNGHKSIAYEHYTPTSEKARRVFYGQFVKKHCKTPRDWYPYLDKRHKIESMLNTIETPDKLTITQDKEQIKIKKKLYYNTEKDTFEPSL